MERCANRGGDTRVYRAEMIGVDLLPEGDFARRAVKKGADAGDGFGQGDRGAAMEIPSGWWRRGVTGIVATTRPGVSSRSSMPSV